MKYVFDELELKLYDGVGDDIIVEDVERQLKEANGQPITIRINSNGGDVFEGFAIYNILRAYPGFKTVYVDGLAASIASVIAFSGDKVIMNKASMMMIHNASSICIGMAKDMENMADALRQIDDVIVSVYMTRSRLTKDEIVELMAQEKFLKPEECLEYGFADEIYEEAIDPQQTQVALDQLCETINGRIATLNKLKGFRPVNKTKAFIANYLKEIK